MLPACSPSLPLGRSLSRPNCRSSFCAAAVVVSGVTTSALSSGAPIYFPCIWGRCSRSPSDGPCPLIGARLSLLTGPSIFLRHFRLVVGENEEKFTSLCPGRGTGRKYYDTGRDYSEVFTTSAARKFVNAAPPARCLSFARREGMM